jgi:hypothetical protein
MKETIFYLEERGGLWLYHFFVLNLGGLYYILHENNKIISQPTNKIQYPIKIYMENVLPFQRETFDIIKDKFILIEDLSKIQDYEVVSIYGESCDTNPYSDNPTVIFPFLRNLFLEKMNFNIITNKRIFITRKNAESQHGGITKRLVINETEFFEKLSKYGFEYIQLENYNTYDKIKLFMESEVIISSHSSALSLILFANKNCKIVELLNKGDPGVPNSHYINIACHLELNYNRFSDIDEDSLGNFNIDCNKFEEYLMKIL